MIVIACVLLVVLITAAFAAKMAYTHWGRPVMLMKWYQNTLETLGYKVITIPFQPFKIPLASIHAFSQKEHKDAFYEEKHSWPGHDIILTNTNNIITLILLNPRTMKAFFSPERHSHIRKSISNKIGFNLLLKDSLILNENEYWKKKRKIFTQILNFEFIASKLPQMVTIATNNSEKIRREAKSIMTQSHKIYKCQLKHIFEDIVSEIVVGMFFGGDEINLSIGGVKVNHRISEILNEARGHANQWPVLLLGEKAYKWGVKTKYRSLNNKITELRGQVKKLLEAKMEHVGQKTSKSHSDLFQALHHLKTKFKGQQLLSIDEFISQFCAFMSASNDSTANYINLLFYCLNKHPQVYQKLQKIIRGRFNSPSDITYAKLRDVDYLEWCLLQTTRMYGPGTGILLRQIDQDSYLDNIPVMKDTGFKIEMLACHYNEKFYKEPYKFDPVRWQELQPPPYTFGSFGFGPHMCMGKNLAYLITKITTVVLMLHYDRMVIDPSQDISLLYKGTYQASPFQTSLWHKIDREQPTRPQLSSSTHLHLD